MKAVILAAGVGSRIRPLTDNKPKSLLEINGKTILGRMLENLSAEKIKDILIITGYLEEQIKAFTSKNFPGINFTFKKNVIYKETNTGYSLLLAKELVENNDFIKLDADVVFEQEILKKLLITKESALCIDKNINLDAEEVKVRVDNKNKILEIGKKINPKEADGESIGIEKITASASKILFSNLEKLMKDKANYNQYYDDQYGVMSKAGVPFSACDISGINWVEIDTHEDYQKALNLFPV